VTLSADQDTNADEGWAQVVFCLSPLLPVEQHDGIDAAGSCMHDMTSATLQQHRRYKTLQASVACA
jgi:hypothetical protein